MAEKPIEVVTSERSGKQSFLRRLKSQSRMSFFLRLMKSRHGQKNTTFEGIPAQIRYCTDVFGIFLLASVTLIFMGLVMYCWIYGDIHRVKNGVDSCGNICGRPIKKKTPGTPTSPLEGRSNEYGPLCEPNNEDKKFLLYQKSDSILATAEHVIKTCVKVCYIGFESHGFKCLPHVGTDVANTIFAITGHENFFKEISEDLCVCWVFLFCLTCIATVMSLVGLIIIRYFALATIWIILLGLLMNALGASLYSWIRWYDLHQEEHPSNAHKKIYNTYLLGGLSATGTFVNLALLMLSLRSRVKLVAELYREAARTFVALSLMSSLWLYITVWIESSGHLTVEGNVTYYKKDAVMHVARWFNFIIAAWWLIFIVGCQDMIVACSVAHWYFIRDKSELKAPIRTSAFYVCRFHLGSLALFALCTSTFRFLRTALKKFEFALINPKNQYIRPLFNCCDCCILFFEKYLALMSRNAYIEMSLHGKNFVTSGREAFLLVVNNRWTMQSISATGDYVLLFLKILAVFPSVIIGTLIYQDIRGINHVWLMIILTALLAFCVSHCFISIIEMVIDTIFICYCYDLKYNDGSEKPYFMSLNLLAFIQRSVTVAEQEGFLDMEFQEP
ncbi:hypothetical protein GE061_003009 [Apolygus lucorum]|uniref:Choline transporter-like protein n=1 Tax=Apolygus lucorum TaxID=248454 RepID=A0A6A4JDM7_APOLU|nr:hypothetical protein GE061_003009 [Apolygus lucorum]